MNKRIAVIGLAVIGLALGGTLAACGSNAEATVDVPGMFNVTQVDVNGKKVTCVTWADYKKGGLSCDWANAK